MLFLNICYNFSLSCDMFKIRNLRLKSKSLNTCPTVLICHAGLAINQLINQLKPLIQQNKTHRIKG